MTTSRRHSFLRTLTQSRAASPLLLAIFASGCAASAIEDEDVTDPLQNLQDDAGSDDDGDHEGDDPAPVSQAGKDAGKPAVSNDSDAGKAIVDAGTSKSDAGASKSDAGASPQVDASTPKDASTPRDAAVATSDAATPPPDASTPTNPNAGNSCKKDSDCMQSCLPVGVATCCTAGGQCGCTWTPGIYCL